MKKNTKLRIVKKTRPNQTVTYRIQQRHWLFRWWWEDVGDNRHSSLKQAQAELCNFDGTREKIEVVDWCE